MPVNDRITAVLAESKLDNNMAPPVIQISRSDPVDNATQLIYVSLKDDWHAFPK